MYIRLLCQVVNIVTGCSFNHRMSDQLPCKFIVPNSILTWKRTLGWNPRPSEWKPDRTIFLIKNNYKIFDWWEVKTNVDQFRRTANRIDNQFWVIVIPRWLQIYPLRTRRSYKLLMKCWYIFDNKYQWVCISFVMPSLKKLILTQHYGIIVSLLNLTISLKTFPCTEHVHEFWFWFRLGGEAGAGLTNIIIMKEIIAIKIIPLERISNYYWWNSSKDPFNVFVCLFLDCG